MNINVLKAYQDIQKIVEPSESQSPKGPKSSEKTKGFGDFLSDAVKDVNELQAKAQHQAESLAMREPGATSHEALISLQKAEMAFQLMNAVRTKIVRAYEEVLRTQV